MFQIPDFFRYTNLGRTDRGQTLWKENYLHLLPLKMLH